MENDAYRSDARYYNPLIADLVRIFREGPSPMTGCIESDFKTSLGLIGGIWPASIREDVEAMIAVPANAVPVDAFPAKVD